MVNNLITEYKDFNYNSEFIPTFNIFNTSSTQGQVGIGTFNPSSFLDITKSVSISNNITISGNLHFNNTQTYDNDSIYILINKTHNIKPVKLTYHSKENFWNSTQNNELFIDSNNIPNTIVEYISPLYTSDEKIFTNSKIYITHILDNYTNVNTLSTPFIIEPYTEYNVSDITSSNNPLYLIGHYDFSSGSYWKQTNSNIYIDKNIGIQINTPTSSLHVIGNTLIRNNLNISALTSYDFNVNKSLIAYNFNTSQIYNNDKLNIYSENILIGNGTNTHYFNVQDNFLVHHNGLVDIKQKANISNNIYLSNNSYIYYPSLNEPYINIKDTSINIGSKYHNAESVNQGCITGLSNSRYNYATLNNNFVKLCNNVIVSDNPTINNDNYTLYIDGNANITNNIICSDYYADNIVSSDSNEINNDSKFKNITTVNDLNVSTQIDSKNTITHNLNISDNLTFIPHNHTTNLSTGTLYYSSNNQKLYGKTDTNIVELQLDKSTNVSNKYALIENSSNLRELNSHITYSTHINTDELFIDDTIKIPSYGSIIPNYNYSSNLGKLRYDKQSILLQVNDGNNWNYISTVDPDNDIYIYKVSYKYNKIIKEDQFINPLFNNQYKLSIINNKITYTLADTTTPEHQKFYINNFNKLYTKNDNSNYPITLFNIDTVNNTSNITLDITQQRIYITPNTLYTITYVPSKKLYKLSYATSTTSDIHKYTIVDYELFHNYNSIVSTIQLYIIPKIYYTDFIYIELVSKKNFIKPSYTIDYTYIDYVYKKFPIQLEAYLSPNNDSKFYTIDPTITTSNTNSSQLFTFTETTSSNPKYSIKNYKLFNETTTSTTNLNVIIKDITQNTYICYLIPDSIISIQKNYFTNNNILNDFTIYYKTTLINSTNNIYKFIHASDTTPANEKFLIINNRLAITPTNITNLLLKNIVFNKLYFTAQLEIIENTNFNCASQFYNIQNNKLQQGTINISNIINKVKINEYFVSLDSLLNYEVFTALSISNNNYTFT
tara:strand:+ start:10827 stop:13841 length:3015 start_codon:yes stop_codon:yes gene_type:complete